jgi:hypothetical protein
MALGHAICSSKKPEPEKDERYDGKGHRYRASDRPKTVRAIAEGNAADVHAPNACYQGCRQENRRQRREYI